MMEPEDTSKKIAKLEDQLRSQKERHDDLEKRLEAEQLETKTKLIEQEHRFFPVFINFFNFLLNREKFPSDEISKYRYATYWAIGYRIISPSTFGGGLVCVATFLGVWAAIVANNLFSTQNALIIEQNKRINIQSHLLESSRRSSFVFLLSNVLDSVDRYYESMVDGKEIKSITEALQTYTLPDHLRGRIISLSQGMQPYYYVDIQQDETGLGYYQGQFVTDSDGTDIEQEAVTIEKESNSHISWIDKAVEYVFPSDRFTSSATNDLQIKLINRPLSPERGQLLMALASYGLIQQAKGTNFSYADLKNVDLSGADLSGAFLQKADLSEADLSEADLSGADLSEAELWEADLWEADLSRAKLSEANLRDANLIDANLIDARLDGANLSGAFLPEAELSDADLDHADLSEANLSGAILWRTQLGGADLSGAHLSDADLREAKLVFGVSFIINKFGIKVSREELVITNLSKADLSGANLSGADLSGANLSQATLSNIKNITQIISLEHANIFEMKDAPEIEGQPFVAWALTKGATAIEDDDEWRRYLLRNKPGILNR